MTMVTGQDHVPGGLTLGMKIAIAIIYGGLLAALVWTALGEKTRSSMIDSALALVR